MDHFESGPGAVIADLPVYDGATLYGFAGDWIALACAAALAAAATARRLRIRAH